MQKLYSLGGRKFAVSGLAPIGCLPIQMTVSTSYNKWPRTCVNQQNDDAMAYNLKLQGLITWMQGSLSGTKIAFVDIYNGVMDMVLNPTKYGKVVFFFLFFKKVRLNRYEENLYVHLSLDRHSCS